VTTRAIPVRQGPPRGILRLAVVAGLVVAAAVTAWLLAAQPWSSAQPGQAGPSAAAIREFEAQTGIRVLRVAVTGQGGIVDLRYSMIAHTAIAHDPNQHPAILDEETGEVIGQPFMGMWHGHRSAEPGNVYYQLFVNQGGLIRPGEHVAVRLGGVTLRGVPVG
jgi:hypothetical protein